MHFSIAARAWSALSAVGPGTRAIHLCDECRDPLALHLDGLVGGEVRDPEIYRVFAREWERDFFNDMDALGVCASLFI